VKVKIFSNNNYEEMEGDINSWLAGKTIKIEKVCQTMDSDNDAYCGMVVISVWYREV